VVVAADVTLMTSGGAVTTGTETEEACEEVEVEVECGTMTMILDEETTKECVAVTMTLNVDHHVALTVLTGLQ